MIRVILPCLFRNGVFQDASLSEIFRINGWKFSFVIFPTKGGRPRYVGKFFVQRTLKIRYIHFEIMGGNIYGELARIRLDLNFFHRQDNNS